MKILLVDDEIQVRKSMKYIIDWEINGYEFLTAENGLKATEIMKNNSVEIILLDISMPVMDGIELLQWIKENNYNCKVLILTCHEEFEYAKKALKYNCVDYMLKNSITSENILSIVNKIRKKINDYNNKQDEILKLKQLALRKEQIDDEENILYWLKDQEKVDIAKYVKERNIFEINREKFILFMIDIKDFSDILNRFSDNNIVEFQNVFDKILREILKQEKYFIIKTESNSRLVFLAFNKNVDDEKILINIKSAMETINNTLEKVLNIQTNIYYSMLYIDFKNSRDHYNLIEKIRSQTYFYNIKDVVCVNKYIFDSEIEQKYLYELLKDLKKNLDMKHIGFFELTIEQFFNNIQEEYVYINVDSFIRCVQNAISLFYYTNLKKEYVLTPIKDLYPLSNLKFELRKMLEPYCHMELNDNKKYIVKKSIIYIKDNYNEDIYLSKVAENIGVSSAYLSRVFSQEVGMSITNYINNFRIDKAKELIENTNLKFYEIGEKIGFSSSISFSTIFKKITGVTPGEYRSKCI